MKEKLKKNGDYKEIILTKEEASILAEELKQTLKEGKKPEEDIRKIKKLIAGLGDPRGLLRRTFSEGLGMIGEKSLPELKNALTNSQNVTVRRAAAKTLKLVGDPSALPDLLNALLTDPDPVVQGSSAGAMAIFGEEAVDYLLEVLKSPFSSSMQCGLAAWGLAFIGSKGAEALKKAAKSDSIKVRAAVIGALEEQIQIFNDEEARRIVKNAIYNSPDEVKIEAIKLAPIFQENEINLSLIADNLKSNNPELRKQTIFLLMKVNAIEKVDNLKLLLLTEKDSSVIPVLQLAIKSLDKEISK